MKLFVVLALFLVPCLGGRLKHNDCHVICNDTTTSKLPLQIIKVTGDSVIQKHFKLCVYTGEPPDTTMIIICRRVNKPIVDQTQKPVPGTGCHNYGLDKIKSAIGDDSLHVNVIYIGPCSQMVIHPETKSEEYEEESDNEDFEFIYDETTTTEKPSKSKKPSKSEKHQEED